MFDYCMLMNMMGSHKEALDVNKQLFNIFVVAVDVVC